MLNIVVFDNDNPHQSAARYWVAYHIDRMVKNGTPVTRIDWASTGVSMRAVYNFVSGKQDMTIGKLSRLAALFNCNMREFFYELPDSAGKDRDEDGS
jgi:hypothetical protein